MSSLAPFINLAYLDPGTGSMLLQALIAAVAGVGVAFAAFKDRLSTLFRRRQSPQKVDKQESDSDGK